MQMIPSRFGHGEGPTSYSMDVGERPRAQVFPRHPLAYRDRVNRRIQGKMSALRDAPARIGRSEDIG
jgi:hypothetical protein